MRLEFAARVDIGPRASNDDRILVDNRVLDEARFYGELDAPATAAVCDGCGGYAGGALAAQTVLCTLSDADPAGFQCTSYAESALENCEKALQDIKEKFPQYQEMCTTIAGCVLGNDWTCLFHSGDSRIYRMGKYGLARMTTDHSVVQELISQGQLTEEEARNAPNRNLIQRCMGIRSLPPEITVLNNGLCPSEMYILCSDGLWEGIRDDEIEEILTSCHDLTEMADTLVETAIFNGSNDNISVCIVRNSEETPIEETTSFELD